MLGDFMKGRDKVIKDPFDVSGLKAPSFFFSLCTICSWLLSGGLEHVQDLLWATLHCMRRFLLSYQWEETLLTLNRVLCFPFFFSLRSVDVMKMNKSEYFCINYRFFFTSAQQYREWQNVIKLKFKRFERFVDCCDESLFLIEPAIISERKVGSDSVRAVWTVRFPAERRQQKKNAALLTIRRKKVNGGETFKWHALPSRHS